MKSVVFETKGEPADVLRVVDAAVPEAAAGEALVRIIARPIQPADLAFIRGRYRIAPIYPQAAGLEAVGELVSAPSGSGYESGQKVALRWPGTWSEFAAVPLDRLIPVPAGINDDDACQMALNPITAWGLLAVADAPSGTALAITAGTSTVSQILTDLARMRGLFTIGIVRGGAAAADGRCKTDVIVDAGSEDLASDIRCGADGRLVTALIDSVGGPIAPRIMQALAPGANMVAYGVMDMTPAAVTNASLIYSNIVWTGFGIDRWLGSLEDGAKTDMMERLWSALRSGELSLPVAGKFDLDAYEEALAADATPGRMGKILLV